MTLMMAAANWNDFYRMIHRSYTNFMRKFRWHWLINIGFNDAIKTSNYVFY